MYIYEYFYLFERSELFLFPLYHQEGKGDKKKKQVKWFLILIKKNMRCKPEMSILLLISFNP